MLRGFRCMRWKSLVVAVLLVAAVAPSCVSASSVTFSYEMVHRFADRGREMLKDRIGANSSLLPASNSFEYHNLLFQLDQRRHRGRHLQQTQYLSFSGDNSTLQWLAQLHYAFLDIGTPKVTFFAALDTGSYLSWFPCDCIQCASLDDPQIDPDLRSLIGFYSPGNSSTSEKVTCSDSFCALKNNCTTSADWCPYEMNYVSANTGSQGNLVRDVLYLGNDLRPGEALQTAPIVFGCAMRQTGDFIDGAALDGLVGLGYQDVSIPSVLAQQGLIADSFSICISNDGEGRLVFGDKGVPQQPSTPFLTSNNAYVAYVVRTLKVDVGSRSISTPGENLFFDTGTSFTYLLSATYQAYIEAFEAQVPTTYKRTQYQGIPFELCYSGSGRTSFPYFDYPEVNFTLYGGAALQVVTPIVELTRQNTLIGFCLGVINGGDLALFGQNMMTGYRFTFDREDNVLGWTQTSCYEDTLSGATPPSSSPLSPPIQEPVASPPESTTPLSPPGISLPPPLVPAGVPVPPPPPGVSVPPPPPRTSPPPPPQTDGVFIPPPPPNLSASNQHVPPLLSTLWVLLVVAVVIFI